jgi:hypothetical protein
MVAKRQAMGARRSPIVSRTAAIASEIASFDECRNETALALGMIFDSIADDTGNAEQAPSCQENSDRHRRNHHNRRPQVVATCMKGCPGLRTRRTAIKNQFA